MKWRTNVLFHDVIIPKPELKPFPSFPSRCRDQRPRLAKPQPDACEWAWLHHRASGDAHAAAGRLTSGRLVTMVTDGSPETVLGRNINKIEALDTDYSLEKLQQFEFSWNRRLLLVPSRLSESVDAPRAGKGLLRPAGEAGGAELSGPRFRGRRLREHPRSGRPRWDPAFTRGSQTPEPADGLFNLLSKPCRSGCRVMWFQVAPGDCSPSSPDWSRRRWAGLRERCVRAWCWRRFSLFSLILCAFAALQPVPDRRGWSRDRGPERRRRLGKSSACWDAGYEEVKCETKFFSSETWKQKVRVQTSTCMMSIKPFLH